MPPVAERVGMWFDVFVETVGLIHEAIMQQNPTAVVGAVIAFAILTELLTVRLSGGRGGDGGEQ